MAERWTLEHASSEFRIPGVSVYGVVDRNRDVSREFLDPYMMLTSEWGAAGTNFAVRDLLALMLRAEASCSVCNHVGAVPTSLLWKRGPRSRLEDICVKCTLCRAQGVLRFKTIYKEALSQRVLPSEPGGTSS